MANARKVGPVPSHLTSIYDVQAQSCKHSKHRHLRDTKQVGLQVMFKTYLGSAWFEFGYSHSFKNTFKFITCSLSYHSMPYSFDTKSKLNNPDSNKRETEMCHKFMVLPLYCWYTLDGRVAGSTTGQDMVADRKQSSSLIIQPSASHFTD
jgi:hypothetical protein